MSVSSSVPSLSSDLLRPLAPEKLAAEAPFQGGNEAFASDAAPLTIGVRDSGVGGLTVAREIKNCIPQARLLYFADTAHVPYGERTPEEVRHFALSITEFLVSQGAQIVVFACNTSSAYALETAKQRFSVPLLGMIEPGARAAIEANESTPELPIGVLATSATVQSRMYARWIERMQSKTALPAIAPLEIACPDFVPLVESEQGSTPAARLACEKALQPLLTAGVHTVILGCTHYPLLIPMLRSVAPEIRFVDPAAFVAREISSLIAKRPVVASSPPPDTFFVSGAQNGVQNWIESLLGNPTPEIVAGPLF